MSLNESFKFTDVSLALLVAPSPLTAAHSGQLFGFDLMEDCPTLRGMNLFCTRSDNDAVCMKFVQLPLHLSQSSTIPGQLSYIVLHNLVV